MDILSDIGAKAVAYVEARAARLAARQVRNRVAGDFSEEHGGDARYDPESEHPMGFSLPFLNATAEHQRAYEATVTAEKSARQKLYAAVRKYRKDTP